MGGHRELGNPGVVNLFIPGEKSWTSVLRRRGGTKGRKGYFFPRVEKGNTKGQVLLDQIEEKTGRIVFFLFQNP